MLSKKVKIIQTQSFALKTLKRIIEKERYPNALLFTGIKGCAKLDTALFFAAAINCEKQNIFTQCDCVFCKRILKLKHQDILIINTKNSTIKIDEIRKINTYCLKPPYEAKKKVIIIADAQKLNKEASNALLKSLEEPPRNTIFILTTTNKYKLLPTIISRCSQVRFKPLLQKVVKEFIEDNIKDNEIDIELTSHLSEGSLNLVIKNNIKKYYEKRNQIINVLNQNSLMASLGFIEKIKNNREAVEENFNIIKSYLKDLIIKKCNGEILNKDFEKEITINSDKISIQNIIKTIESVQDAQKKIENNGSINQNLTGMFIKFNAKNCQNTI